MNGFTLLRTLVANELQRVGVSGSVQIADRVMAACVESLGGSRVYVPNQVILVFRDTQIQRDAALGISSKEIAQRYQLSQRQVQRVIKKKIR